MVLQQGSCSRHPYARERWKRRRKLVIVGLTPRGQAKCVKQYTSGWSKCLHLQRMQMIPMKQHPVENFIDTFCYVTNFCTSCPWKSDIHCAIYFILIWGDRNHMKNFHCIYIFPDAASHGKRKKERAESLAVAQAQSWVTAPQKQSRLLLPQSERITSGRDRATNSLLHPKLAHVLQIPSPL